MSIRDELAVMVRSARALLATPARLAPLQREYSDRLGLRLPFRYLVDVEDAEAKTRAITGCTPEQARAHVLAAHQLELQGLTDDPCGFAVRTLASGGDLLDQDDAGGSVP